VQAIASRRSTPPSFEYLIGRFTEPAELFGALDLNALKEGQVRAGDAAACCPKPTVAFPR
jgi:MoxR-like ATPase